MHGPHTGPHRSRGLVSAGFYGVVLVSLPTLAQSVASGSLDACHEDGTLVAGWAKDDNYNGSIAVHFYVDGALVKALMADDYRSDVGNSSFEWIPPPFGAGDHTVSAYAIGVDAHGSPSMRAARGSRVRRQSGVQVFRPTGNLARRTLFLWATTSCAQGST